MSRNVVFGLLVAAAIGVSMAGLLEGQVPTIKGKGSFKKSIAFTVIDVDIGQQEDVYTVPPGRKLILTDVVIDNPNTGEANATNVRKNGEGVIEVALPASSAFAHSFVSGPEFVTGDVLQVHNASAQNNVRFSLFGYLVKD